MPVKIKINFKISNFKKFKHKIHYMVIDDLPIDVKPPKRGWHENHAKKFQEIFERGYRKYNDDD